MQKQIIVVDMWKQFAYTTLCKKNLKHFQTEKNIQHENKNKALSLNLHGIFRVLRELLRLQEGEFSSTTALVSLALGFVEELAGAKESMGDGKSEDGEVIGGETRPISNLDFSSFPDTLDILLESCVGTGD